MLGNFHGVVHAWVQNLAFLSLGGILHYKCKTLRWVFNEHWSSLDLDLDQLIMVSFVPSEQRAKSWSKTSICHPKRYNQHLQRNRGHWILQELLPVIHPHGWAFDLRGADASNNAKANVFNVQTAISKYAPIAQLFQMFCKFGEKSTVNIWNWTCWNFSPNQIYE